MNQIPKLKQMIEPIFIGLKELDGEAKFDLIYDKVVLQLDIDEEFLEIKRASGNRTEFEYRLAWALAYLKKDELIESNQRGTWKLTSKGKHTSKIDVDLIFKKGKRK